MSVHLGYWTKLKFTDHFTRVAQHKWNMMLLKVLTLKVHHWLTVALSNVMSSNLMVTCDILQMGFSEFQLMQVAMWQKKFKINYCSLRGCLHHGPWSRPKALLNLWLAIELVPGPLWFTQRKKCDHGVRGPQNTYFKAYIIQWHSPMGFAVGEAKEVLLQEHARAHDREMLL